MRCIEHAEVAGAGAHSSDIVFDEEEENVKRILEEAPGEDIWSKLEDRRARDDQSESESEQVQRWNLLWQASKRSIGRTLVWQNLSHAAHEKTTGMVWSEAWLKWKWIYQYLLEILQKREERIQIYTPVARTRAMYGVL